MEWIREVKLQNGFGHDTKSEGESNESAKVLEVNNTKPEKNCDALNIEILEKKITEKKKAREEIMKESQETPKQQDPCSHIPSSSGLDESTFQEEME